MKIEEIIVVLAIGGGFGYLLSLVIEIARGIVGLFGWSEWDLTEKEKDEISAIMIGVDRSRKIEEIVRSRGISWKSFSYNNVERKLKVK